jgi:hypothetical protein
MLVINQLVGIYECRSEVLISYHERCLQLLKEFRDFCLEHISQLHNKEANRLVQHASGFQPIQEVLTSAVDTDDWRKEIVDYLRDPSKKVERHIRFQATKYVLLKDELYYRTIDGVLLRCINGDESKSLMGEIHEGVCGAHQSAFKMKWMIRRNRYYWSTILEDCFKYFKGCQGCQKFGNIQRVPASAMNPIIKPWSFRGWAINLIGQIYPPSSKGHKFILVATDYFTKWVKEFADGDLVWKLILPIGTKSSKFGKWCPNWEGPYWINQSIPGNTYILETLKGVVFPRALNGKYLKKYYPSIWMDA